MRETIEFRVPKETADEHLPAELGAVTGSVRKIALACDDPLIGRISRLQKEFCAEGRAFFHGWMVRRDYSRRELAEAQLLHVRPQRVFEPAGEECGTMYDEALACDQLLAERPETEIGGHRVPRSVDSCGVGAIQVTPLFIDGRRIPRQDFSQSIAGEMVVSARVVEVFHETGLSGVDFDPVRLSDRPGKSSEDYYQLNVLGRSVELESTTRAGENPFDEGSYGRCPRGHIIGLSLLSEVRAKGATLLETDVMATRQMVGVRRGLLRPRPILLLSPRAFRAIENAKLNGLVVEVAHVS